jgi:hypothetical protein
MHGNRCYGCNGGGWKLTKRGKATRAFYVERLQKAAPDIEVGDWIRDGGCRFKVVNIDINKNQDGVNYYTFINGNQDISYGAFEHQSIVIRWKQDHIDALRVEAIAFQDSLTKAGTVRKRKVKK